MSMGFWTGVRLPSVPPSIHTSKSLIYRDEDVCFYIFVRFCCINSSFPLHCLKSYGLSGTLLRLYQSYTLEIQRSVFTPICSVKIGEIGDFGYNSIKTLGFLMQKVGRFFVIWGICSKSPILSGKSGIHFKPLRKKYMLRRAKHGQPCPDIPCSFQRHTGFPSREGKLYGANG